MAIISTVPAQWNMRVVAGSLAQYTFTFTDDNGDPYQVSSSWEYVVRSSPQNAGTPLVSVTTTSSDDGVISVNASTGTVELSLYPAATSVLGSGNFSHALWSDQGTAQAFCWVRGLIIAQPTPQP